MANRYENEPSAPPNPATRPAQWIHQRQHRWKDMVLRRNLERVDKAWDKKRHSLLELASMLAEGSQTAAWFCGSATGTSADEIRADAQEYKDRMRVILPRLCSAHAAASGPGKAAYPQIDSLLQRLIALDQDLGRASARLDTEPDGALQELKDCLYPAANQLTQDIQDVEAGMFTRSRSPGVAEGAALGPDSPAYN